MPETADRDLPATTPVEEQLVRLFRSFKQFWHRTAAELYPDLQPLGYGLLVAVTKAGPQTMGALAERMAIDKAVLSRQVRQLVDLGLAEVDTDPQDGRVRILRARPEVVEVVSAQRRRAMTPVGTELATWTPEELATFSALLERLLPTFDGSGCSAEQPASSS